MGSSRSTAESNNMMYVTLRSRRWSLSNHSTTQHASMATPVHTTCVFAALWLVDRSMRWIIASPSPLRATASGSR